MPRRRTCLPPVIEELEEIAGNGVMLDVWVIELPVPEAGSCASAAVWKFNEFSTVVLLPGVTTVYMLTILFVEVTMDILTNGRNACDESCSGHCRLETCRQLWDGSRND